MARFFQKSTPEPLERYKPESHCIEVASRSPNRGEKISVETALIGSLTRIYPFEFILNFRLIFPLTLLLSYGLNIIIQPTGFSF